MAIESGSTSSGELRVTEEFGTETVVRVVEESVLVVRVHGGGVLAQELGLPVVHLGGGAVLNGGDLNVDSEGVSGEGVGSVEEISEGGKGHVGEFTGDGGDNDSSGGIGTGKVGLVGGLVLSGVNLGEAGGSLGSTDEGADVGVVALAEDVLVSGLVGGDGSDVDGLSVSEVGELQLGAEGVPGVTGVISKSELVGVFIELVDLSDFSLDIKVFTGSNGGGLVEGGNGSDGGGSGHVSGGPLSEGREDGGLVLLEGRAFVGVGNGGVATGLNTESGLLVGGEEGPRSSEVGVEVELSSVVIDSEGGSVDSDDVSHSVDNWEILKSVSEDNEVGPVVFLARSVEGSVNDLEGADESVLGHLVGEGGINDDSVDVVGLSGDNGGVVEEGVVGGSGLVSGSFLGGGLSSGHVCCGYLKLFEISYCCDKFKIA